MPIWSEIRPPQPADRPTSPAPHLLTRPRRKTTIWLPAVVAIAFALIGLGLVANQQSAINPEPTIRDTTAPTTTRPTLIDINSATITELATLPGIGVSRAEAIVQLRAQRAFSSLADLADRGVLRPGEVIDIANLATAYVTVD